MGCKFFLTVITQYTPLTLSTRFLLAHLHLESLKDKLNPKAIRNTLKGLPKGPDALNITFDEAIERINGQRSGFKELAEQVLSWITYAQRPLTILELQHALAVEPGEPKLDEENLSDIEDLVSVCAGLVTVDQESSIVRLVHLTAQEYFERIRLKRFPNAQSKITTTCLTYLSFDVFAKGYCLTDEILENRLQQNPLFDYAARYWSSHVCEAVEQSIQGLALKFIMDDSKVSSSSQVLFITKYRYYGYSQRAPKQFSGIHLVAYLGLKDLMNKLLENGDELDSKASNGRTPLSWAVENGHEAMVELLVEKGAELDSKDIEYGLTPLSWAAAKGQEALVKLLVEKGAKLESKDTRYGRTPLSLAAEMGYEAVVKLL